MAKSDPNESASASGAATAVATPLPAKTELAKKEITVALASAGRISVA
jgi:hypothetical protein